MACNWKGGDLMCQYTWQECAGVISAIFCFAEIIVLMVKYPVILVLSIIGILGIIVPALHEKCY